MGSGDVFGSDPHDVSNAGFGEVLRASGVAGDLGGIVVDFPVDLEDEPQLGAVEVDDVAANHLLATELQSEAFPVAEQSPRDALRDRRASSKRACKLLLLR